MKKLHILKHIIWADFLERTRRYSFLITLGVMVYVGYLAVPAIDSGILTVNLGDLRGVYNSAWVGSMVALISSFILSLPGFYLVKNALARDRESGVGQIIATTSLSKSLYMMGKALSNLVYLIAILGVIVVMAGSMQLVRGEVTTVNIWDLIAPFMFTALPTMALVAAAAVFFESIPLLKKGFGNLVYFALWTAAIVISLSAVSFGEQGAIQEPINDLFGASLIGSSMHQAAREAYPSRQLDLGIGYTQVEGEISTFLWKGVNFNNQVIVERMLWVGAALMIIGAAAVIFNRFDPARDRPRRHRGGSFRVQKILGQLPRINFPRLQMIDLSRWPLPPFFRVLIAELKLALKGQAWWWYIAAGGLFVAGISASDLEALRWVLVASWIWPVLIWSKFGVRETLHQTGKVVFSSPHPLKKQLFATWCAAVLVTMFTGGGAGIRMLSLGSYSQLLSWCSAALFIPSLALALGIWTGTGKTFEALYVTIWYLGPINGLAELDFMGVTASTLKNGIIWYYILATILFGGLIVAGRIRQVRY